MSIVPESEQDGQWASKSISVNRLWEDYARLVWGTGLSRVQVGRSSTAPPAPTEPSAFWPAPTKAPLQLRFQPQPARCASWTSESQPHAAAPRRLRDSAAARGRTSGSLPAFRWLRAQPSAELRRGEARGDRLAARSA